METISVKKNIDLLVHECGTCGISFALPQTLYDRCFEEGDFFHCPLGHRRGWHEGSKERKKKDLKKQLEQERKKREWAEQEAKNSENRRRAAQGQITKLKNRSKAGVCPCCNRTFKQLAAHMKNKHPNFADSHE